MPALSIQNLSLSFGNRSLFKSLSFSLDSGEAAVLFGPSGCGKSSLLACIGGFLKPDEGTIQIDDTPLSADNVWAFRQKIAYVPQTLNLGTDTVGGWLNTVLDYKANQHLCMGGIDSELDALGLGTDILGQSADDVSGGEKQRLALTVALLLKRPILLLDEPSSALDAKSKSKLFERLEKLGDTVLLMVSHEHQDTISFPHQRMKLGD